MRLLTGLVVSALAIALIPATPAGAKGYDPHDYRPVGNRTTDSGIELRMYSGEVDAPPFYDGNRRLPNACFPNAALLVGVSNERVAETTESTWNLRTGGLPKARVVGTREGSPIGVVMLPAPDRTTHATLRVLGRPQQDAAEPMNRWFVLAARLPRHQFTEQFPTFPRRAARVTVYGPDGKRMSSAYARDGDETPFVASDLECQSTSSVGLTPMPSGLPDATGAPPVDEPAARQAVIAAYEGTYSAGGDTDAALTHVEGGNTEEVRSAQRTSGARAMQYRGRITGRVDEVKFLNEREAAVRYSLILDGRQPLVGNSIGRAVLVDGEWKVARSTYCELLAAGGSGARC